MQILTSVALVYISQSADASLKDRHTLKHLRREFQAKVFITVIKPVEVI